MTPILVPVVIRFMVWEDNSRRPASPATRVSRKSEASARTVRACSCLPSSLRKRACYYSLMAVKAVSAD